MTQLAVAPVAGPLGGALPGLEFAPGTNPNGDLSYADWRFLLPGLRFRTVLFLGVPAVPVLAALARTAERIVVASGELRALQRVRAAARQRGLDNVHGLLTASPQRLPCADGSLDLVVLCEARMASRVLGRPDSADELSRVLAPDGTIYLEVGRHLDVLRAGRWSRRLATRGFDVPQAFWLLRNKAGGVRLAFPLEQARAVRYAFDHVLYGTSRRARVLRWIGRSVSRAGLHHHLVPDRALVFHRRESGPVQAAGTPGPSRYLSALAARAGVELGTFQPGFFARGGYDSNKVAFFLFGDAAPEPATIVKMTRSPRYNHRLEAEHRALAQLRTGALADEGTYPEALFFGHHHDLAVLAERVVPGSPFRTRTRGDTTCPFARAAIRWIEELGARSAGGGADATELPRMLADLLARFERVYALTEGEREYLRDRVHSLGTLPVGIPTVFQHGDAGTWNVLVTGDERVAFLDWEVSSARGVPLWDLVDFLRSFGSWAARSQGEKDMVRAYATHFLAPSPFSELQAEAVRSYRSRVGLPREGMEALFLSCWMHRAVREAAWTSAPLDQGFYLNLVRTCIRQRDAEGLKWLFD